MSDFNLEKRVWWGSLDKDLKGLIEESVLLIEKVPSWEEKFDDYSFIVFPAAKAYEGFLKNVFLDMGFISQKEFLGKHFRIGRALNPNFSKSKKRPNVYNKIAQYCGGVDLSDKLWDTWKNSRNVLFHWFPEEKNIIDLPSARERVMQILSAMDEIYKTCKIK